MRESVLAAAALAAALAILPAAAQTPRPVASVGAPAQAPQAAGWWRLLGDPVLEQLVARGLEGNLGLEQSGERIRRSQALLAGARAAFGPRGGASLQAQSAQASETEAPGLTRAQRQGERLGTGIDISWELDLFGRLGSQAAAATQRVQASQALWQGARLAISAEIAHAYFALLGAREQLELARTTAANRQRTLELVSVRARGGIAAPIDGMRARADLEAALADIPLHETAARVASHRLAVLTGQSPHAFELPVAGAVDAREIPLTLPDAPDWLSRRPDLQALEAELRARALDADAIRAEFYPRLTLAGALGFVAGSVSRLASGASVSWLAGPSLLAPLFDRPRIEARLQAAEAGQQEALLAYRERVLLAVEEIENALARYTGSRRQLQNLQRRAELAAQARQLSQRRYQAGAADLLELLDAQRTAQQAEAALSVALVQQRQHVVDFFKAIGAGA